MKATISVKEFIEVIKSGIVGALALTGVCLLLIAAGNTISLRVISFIYTNTIAKWSLTNLFLFTSVGGFIAGIIARRNFPVIQKGIMPMAIAAIPLILGSWFVYVYASHVKIPKNVKLIDCTTSNKIASAHIHIPKGNNYYLLENTSLDHQNLSGHVSIFEGTNLLEDMPFNGEQVQWGLPNVTYILTDFRNATNNMARNQIIQPQKDYDIVVAFDRLPPPLTSIWLHWEQTHNESKK